MRRVLYVRVRRRGCSMTMTPGSSRKRRRTVSSLRFQREARSATVRCRWRKAELSCVVLMADQNSRAQIRLNWRLQSAACQLKVAAFMLSAKLAGVKWPACDQSAVRFFTALLAGLANRRNRLDLVSVPTNGAEALFGLSASTSIADLLASPSVFFQASRGRGNKDAGRTVSSPKSSVPSYSQRIHQRRVDWPPIICCPSQFFIVTVWMEPQSYSDSMIELALLDRT